MDAEDTRDTLEAETRKWRAKLDEKLDAVAAVDEDGEEILANAAAYWRDAHFFAEDEDDLVRAFESVIWGWAYIDLGVKYGFLREE